MKKQCKKTIEGLIILKGRRGGVVFDKKNDAPIEIPKEDLNTALHEDYVRVCVLSGDKGKVEAVITRAKEEFVGTVEKDGKEYRLKPYDTRLYPRIIIPKESLRGAKEGDRVLIALTAWDDPKKNPIGAVKTVIGASGKHETEIQSILLDKGFEIGFPQEVLREAKKIKEEYPTVFPEELKKRRDYRDAPTFTIDPETAKDFDDALSVIKLENGNFEIGIHIADPTFFVRRHSVIDKHAASTTTSIYLVDRTIPMLPEVLSNDLCSLNPHEDKLTFSAILTLTPEAKVVDRWLGRTVTHSNKRFSYEDAQKILDAGKGEYAPELLCLNTLAKKLKKERKEKGALEFESEEISFKLDAEGRPIAIFKKERTESHKLIEEFMILANSEVAEFMTNYDKRVHNTFVYRVHDVPDEDKMQELLTLLRALDYELPKKKEDLGLKEIDAILEKVKDTPHEELVQMAVLRAMSKAIYTTKNIGHFGLSLKYYTHFTSPIRRYPDMMVHRLLANCLAGKKIPEEELKKYESLTRYATQMEILATKAERESIKYKQTEYMADHIGEAFSGTITGFSESGMYVREETTLSEGMIRLSDLNDDYYTLDDSGFHVIGRKTGKKYSLGDSVSITVKDANIERKQIDYELKK